MISKKRQILAVVLVALLLTQSGCALLQVPATIVGETFKLVGKVLDLAGKLPMPPPGVF